jgi:hypothetical protein
MVRIKAAVTDYLSTNQALVALANLKIQGYGLSLGHRCGYRRIWTFTTGSRPCFR